jgi:hypothetical protein
MNYEQWTVDYDIRYLFIIHNFLAWIYKENNLLLKLPANL